MALGLYAITLPSVSLTVVPKLTLLLAAATDDFDLSDRSGDKTSPPSKTAQVHAFDLSDRSGDKTSPPSKTARVHAIM